MSSLDNHGSDGAADAVVDALGEHVVHAGGVKIEGAGIGPMSHDGEPVEQRDALLISDNMHAVGIRPERDHDVGPGAVLHVHQNDVRSAVMQRIYASIKRPPATTDPPQVAGRLLVPDTVVKNTHL